MEANRRETIIPLDKAGRDFVRWLLEKQGTATCGTHTLQVTFSRGVLIKFVALNPESVA